MSEIRQEIFKEIDIERRYQEKKWGKAFDMKNTISDWATFISYYTTTSAMGDKTTGERREDLIKAAALAVAALESIDSFNDLPKRHFD